jgi:hypothetical protein
MDPENDIGPQNGEMEVLPWEPKKSARVVGHKYMSRNQQVQIWKGRNWHCIHDKRTNRCLAGCAVKHSWLAVTHPELKAEWHPDNNDFTSYHTHGVAFVKWVCPTGHTYIASITSRTSKKSGCRLCHLASTLQIDPVVKKRKQMHVSEYAPTVTGDATEDWCVDKLIALNKFSKVERIGNTGDKTDIVVTLGSNDTRCIQVKTLTRTNANNSFMVQHSEYTDRMLMMMVDKSRTKFVVDYFENLGPGNWTFTFGFSGSKHAQRMYTDESLFMERITELIPSAAKWEQSLSDSTAKEFSSLSRLEEACMEQGLTWKRNPRNDNTIDGWINDYPVQAKFCSRNEPDSATYKISTQKSGGVDMGRTIWKAYSISEPFEYFIVEVGGTRIEQGKYQGQFCIIPKQVMRDHGVFQSDECEGKHSIHICPPDYARNHWSKSFWNHWPLSDFKKRRLEPANVQSSGISEA